MVCCVVRHGLLCACSLFDLKSHNVLLTRDGTAKIADVGLAKVLTQVPLPAPAAHWLVPLYATPVEH